MIFQQLKWHFDVNWYKFGKKVGLLFFQIYSNAIHFIPLQFCPSSSLLGFYVFSLSSSIFLTRYFDNLVTSMTIWSVLKLPKTAWPSPFKQNATMTVTRTSPKKRFNQHNKCTDYAKPQTNFCAQKTNTLKWNIDVTIESLDYRH